jgi:hypothetical protein
MKSRPAPGGPLNNSIAGRNCGTLVEENANETIGSPVGYERLVFGVQDLFSGTSGVEVRRALARVESRRLGFERELQRHLRLYWAAKFDPPGGQRPWFA